MRSPVTTANLTVAGVLATVLLGVTAWAATRILHPEMAPAAGSYGEPAGTLGASPEKSWSDTTIEAAVNAKPLDGKVVTVVGEVVDLSCYLQLGKHGEKHRACGQKCVEAGAPFGLLAEDGAIYVLMPEEHHPRRDGQTDLRAAAVENMARIVRATGALTEVEGVKSLYVSGFVKK